MIINIKLLRSAYYFLGNISLKKHDDPVQVDLTQQTDGFIRSLLLSIKAGTLDADIELQDLTKFIKDIPSRVEAQRFLGLKEDIVEAKPFTAQVEAVEAEATEEETGTEGEDDEEGQEEGLLVLDHLLVGSVKQVVAKVKKANLADEQKIELISIEEAGKNRSIVIAAINEA